MSANTCRQCGSAAESKHITGAAGEEAGVRVAIDTLPAYECANGHRRFLTPAFPMALIEALRKAKDVFPAPPARQKGLFRKRLLCPGCDGELPAEADAKGSSRVEVSVGDERIGVALSVPLHRCAGCGKEAMGSRDDVTELVMRAAANAFRSVEIQPG